MSVARRVYARSDHHSLRSVSPVTRRLSSGGRVATTAVERLDLRKPIGRGGQRVQEPDAPDRRRRGTVRERREIAHHRFDGILLPPVGRRDDPEPRPTRYTRYTVADGLTLRREPEPGDRVEPRAGRVERDAVDLHVAHARARPRERFDVEGETAHADEPAAGPLSRVGVEGALQ